MPRNIGTDGQGDHAGQKLRSQIVNRDDEAQKKSNYQARQRQFIGQQLGFCVGEDEAQKQKSQHTAFKGIQREPQLGVAGQEQ